MKLLIIRHGQTDGNVKGLVQGAGLDLPLNETGRAQAAAAAEKLLSLHLPVIYSSTMLRARQTAEIIAAGGRFSCNFRKTSASVRECKTKRNKR